MNKRNQLKRRVNAKVLARKARRNRKQNQLEVPYKYIKTTSLRRLRRGTRDAVSSTKIGAGDVVVRRKLDMTTVHKRNHRTTEKIGINLS